VSARASVLMWSAGSGIVIGLIFDALLVGAWMVASNFLPSISPRSLPRWAMIVTIAGLAVIPIVACLLGYLEGRLKLS
jgi:small-conductance mechanosensitive channel